MNKLRDLFLLDPEITYLNFGSFGACVRPVFEQYQQFQLEIEREPSQFFFKNGPRYLKESRDALGKYLNVNGDDLVMVSNPSYAVNIVAKSLNLNPGDEILTTDIEYGACDKAWNFYCKKADATIKRVSFNWPLRDNALIVEAIKKGITPKTRLIFISHITSSTAVLLPVEEICSLGKKHGIPVFVDGAHGPGQVPCDLSKMGADMYTGACHKWMMTPKGSAFLYVNKKWQDKLEPLIVSWGYESEKPSHSRFLDYHEGQGTRDYSAFLTIPRAIAFMNEHNWENVATWSRQMVLDNAEKFSIFSGGHLLAEPSFLTQMLSIPVACRQPEKLQEIFFSEFRIEIPVMKHGNSVFVRFSINAFNSQADLDKLYDAMIQLQKRGLISAPKHLIGINDLSVKKKIF